jgi:L-amino acid N-acyltransferase YncA
MNKNKHFLEVIIRKANLKDEKELLLMRNDPITRLVSFNKEIISASEHEKWFKKKLKERKSTIYVAEKKNIIIGVTQFNYDIKKDLFEVNINLKPNFRKAGYGSYILSKSITVFSKKNICTLSAVIKKENIDSIKCFQNCGFGLLEENSNIITLQNKNILIDKIETIRSKNNVNWMDLMRLAFKISPKEAQKIFGNINIDDNEISDLLKKLIK